jgi:tetratricopeptide (TPR) repeat protein
VIIKHVTNKSVVLTLLAALVLVGCNRTPAAYVVAGDKYLAQQKYDDAILQYRKAVQKDPNYADAFYRLSRVEMREGRLAAAHELLKRAVELAPERKQLSIEFGDLIWYIYNADNRPAPSLYMELSHVSQKLLEGNPQDFDGLRFKAYLATFDKHVDDAVALLEQANSLRPAYPDVTMPLARLLSEKGQNAHAEELIQRTLRQNPSYGSGYSALYVLYMREHRTADAEAILRQRVENKPRDAQGLIELAEHYVNQNNAAAMNAALQRLRDHRSEFPGARMALGDFYALHKNSEQSLKEFQQAIQEDPKNEIAYRKKMVTVLMAQGQSDQARTALDQILKRAPKDEEALRLKAGFDLKSQEQPKIDEAVSIYRELSKGRPNDSDLRFYYGRALLASGKTQAALGELTAAVQRAPSNPAPKLALADLLVNQGLYAKGLQVTSDILDQDPLNENARLLRAMALGALGERQQARDELSRLIHDRPGNSGAELQLGLLDIVEKRYPEAKAIFAKHYHPGQPDLRPIEGLVRTEVVQGNFDRALALLQQELQRSPKSNLLRLTTASVAASAGRLDLAAEQYQTLAASLPDSSSIQIQWAETLHAKKDVPGAIEHYRKAKALDPNHPNPAALLGRELERDGQTQEAIASYRDALKIDPNHVLALNNLAFLLANEGKDLDEALRMAQNAQRLVNGNLAVADTLGWVYLKKGLTSSALQVFENIVQKDPKNPTYRYHLAEALLASGERVKAKTELQKALESRPSQPEEHTITELLAKIS